ncbi:hypothetical protein [Burkholderia sp. F1]|uniref:hypothetical protein n=1 Tax=Burkholderia sp. F1 TaxID=3366817 RepID=UPI003D72B49B
MLIASSTQVTNRMRIVTPFRPARLPSAAHRANTRKRSSVSVRADPCMRAGARSARYDRGHSTLPETAMQPCCSRRTAFAGPLPPASLRKAPRSGSRAVRSAIAAAGAFVLGIVGWRWFESLLNAVPDSNDDFGIV